MATNIILSIAKIMPTSAEASSLLECYAEWQLILFKDNANECRSIKFT